MRITRKWLRDKKDEVQHELRRLAPMSNVDLRAELKRSWPSYDETLSETTAQHRLAIIIDLFIDRTFRPAID